MKEDTAVPHRNCLCGGVSDMLTGFNVSIEQVRYLDKKIKKHPLLQAIQYCLLNRYSIDIDLKLYLKGNFSSLMILFFSPPGKVVCF